MKEAERFQRAFEDAAIGIALLAVKPLGKYLEVNPTFCRMTGYSRDELLARDFQSITASQDIARNLQQVETLLNGKTPSLQLEKRYVRKDAGAFWASVNVSLVRDNRARPLYFIVQIEDIDEHKRAEEALRESQRTLSTLLSNLSGMAYRCRNDVNWTMEFVSEGCFGLTGHHASDLAVNRTIAYSDLIHPDDRDWLWEKCQRSLDARQPCRNEYRIVTADGNEKWVWEQARGVYSPAGGLIAIEGFITDITERKRLEEQLRHAQKLEAIGQLAGGVAHEFNNMLTAIIGNLDLAIGQILPDSDQHSTLTGALQAARRAAMLTQQLLTFSHRSPMDSQPQDLGTIATEVVNLLRQTIDRRIQVSVRSPDGIWPVLADAGQMHQVIMNLCVNARDSLLERMEKTNRFPGPAGWEPRILISTENVRLDEAHCKSHYDARPGEFVCLSVSDNGCGIDEGVRHRIFEPFFTTKEVGRGTGLGLAAVYGIIKHHEGWIDLSSAKDAGTTFKFYLPRTDRTAGPTPRGVTGKGIAHGSETLLFVDDEASIRRLGQTILEHHGYTVLLAKNGEEALEIFQRERDRIRLVVLDLTMPRMSGREVLKQILRLDPAIRVLISTGHQMTGDSNELQNFGTVRFVPKPYRPDDLARSVRNFLDAPVSSQ